MGSLLALSRLLMFVVESVPATATVVVIEIAKTSTEKAAFNSKNPKMDVIQAQDDSDTKKRMLQSLLRKYNPAPMGVAALRRHHAKYHYELSAALTTLGTQTVSNWKNQIGHSEVDIVDFVNRVKEKLDNLTTASSSCCCCSCSWF